MGDLEGTRFLVVDDDPLAVRAVGRVLETAGARVESATCVGSAKEALVRGVYDGAVVDLHLLDDSGLRVIELLRALDAPCSALMITGDSRMDRWREAIARGAEDFLVKPFQPMELLDAARQTVARTRAWRDRLCGKAARPDTPSKTIDPGAYLTALSERGRLTDVERRVLALVLRGKSNREIADEAALTIRNVKYYMSRILEKLGVESRTDLLAGVFDRS